MADVFDLFPTPLMRVPGAIAPDAAMDLRRRFGAEAGTANERSNQLAHTRVFAPGEDPALQDLTTILGPHVQAFGELLFGEPLRWLVKEMWINVLRSGGSQAVHNHANCFVSGVLYLTPSNPSSPTTFIRSLGGREFAFRNTHQGVGVGPYTADKWVAPAGEPGDLILFPSYLLHEVPPHRGETRVSLAFNAIPHRLDAWGYAVSFQP
ncbi:MAG: hypothetical protein H7322_17510 [Ramlibacter sp.]|nr:hypothetical protein [Ramlibacter sp.]